MLFELIAHHLPGGWIRRHIYVGDGSLWSYYNPWTHIPGAGSGHSFIFATTQSTGVGGGPSNTISDKGQTWEEFLRKMQSFIIWMGLYTSRHVVFVGNIFTSDRFVEPDGWLRSLLAASTQDIACFIHTDHPDSESRRIGHSVLILMYGRCCGGGLVQSSNVRFCRRA